MWNKPWSSCRAEEDLPSGACAGLGPSIAIPFLLAFNMFSQECLNVFSQHTALYYKGNAKRQQQAHSLNMFTISSIPL